MAGGTDGEYKYIVQGSSCHLVSWEDVCRRQCKSETELRIKLEEQSKACPPLNGARLVAESVGLYFNIQLHFPLSAFSAPYRILSYPRPKEEGYYKLSHGQLAFKFLFSKRGVLLYM